MRLRNRSSFWATGNSWKRALGIVQPPKAGAGCTLVVTDIESSTNLWELLDEKVMDHAISMHHAAFRKAITHHGGYEAQLEGDSFCVAFHAPRDAVQFCLALQDALLWLDWPSELLALPMCQPLYVSRIPMTPVQGAPFELVSSFPNTPSAPVSICVGSAPPTADPSQSSTHPHPPPAAPRYLFSRPAHEALTPLLIASNPSDNDNPSVTLSPELGVQVAGTAPNLSSAGETSSFGNVATTVAAQRSGNLETPSTSPPLMVCGASAFTGGINLASQPWPVGPEEVTPKLQPDPSRVMMRRPSLKQTSSLFTRNSVAFNTIADACHTPNTSQRLPAPVSSVRLQWADQLHIAALNRVQVTGCKSTSQLTLILEPTVSQADEPNPTDGGFAFPERSCHSLSVGTAMHRGPPRSHALKVGQLRQLGRLGQLGHVESANTRPGHAICEGVEHGTQAISDVADTRSQSIARTQAHTTAAVETGCQVAGGQPVRVEDFKPAEELSRSRELAGQPLKGGQPAEDLSGSCKLASASRAGTLLSGGFGSVDNNCFTSEVDIFQTQPAQDSPGALSSSAKDRNSSNGGGTLSGKGSYTKSSIPAHLLVETSGTAANSNSALPFWLQSTSIARIQTHVSGMLARPLKALQARAGQVMDVNPDVNPGSPTSHVQGQGAVRTSAHNQGSTTTTTVLESIRDKYHVVGAGEPGAEMTFRGLRVRMGCHSGLSAGDYTHNKVANRMHYNGPAAMIAKACCDAGFGGQLLITEATHILLSMSALNESAMVLHMGEHKLKRGIDSFGIHQILSRRLMPRVITFPPIKSLHHLSLGVLDAAAGHVTIVFMHVIGEDTLSAWRPDIADEALPLFQATVGALLHAHGGYLVEGNGGFVLVSFAKAHTALRWALQCVDELKKVDWPEDLLRHELGEEIITRTVDPLTQQVHERVIMRGLRVRAGIDCGRLRGEISWTTGRMCYRGKSMNRAARVAAAAGSCQVLASRNAVQESEYRPANHHQRSYTTISLGAFQLKGVRDALEVFEVQSVQEGGGSMTSKRGSMRLLQAEREAQQGPPGNPTGLSGRGSRPGSRRASGSRASSQQAPKRSSTRVDTEVSALSFSLLHGLSSARNGAGDASLPPVVRRLASSASRRSSVSTVPTHVTSATRHTTNSSQPGTSAKLRRGSTHHSNVQLGTYGSGMLLGQGASAKRTSVPHLQHSSASQDLSGWQPTTSDGWVFNVNDMGVSQLARVLDAEEEMPRADVVTSGGESLLLLPRASNATPSQPLQLLHTHFQAASQRPTNGNLPHRQSHTSDTGRGSPSTHQALLDFQEEFHHSRSTPPVHATDNSSETPATAVSRQAAPPLKETACALIRPRSRELDRVRSIKRSTSEWVRTTTPQERPPAAPDAPAVPSGVAQGLDRGRLAGSRRHASLGNVPQATELMVGWDLGGSNRAQQSPPAVLGPEASQELQSNAHLIQLNDLFLTTKQSAASHKSETFSDAGSVRIGKPGSQVIPFRHSLQAAAGLPALVPADALLAPTLEASLAAALGRGVLRRLKTFSGVDFRRLLVGGSGGGPGSVTAAATFPVPAPIGHARPGEQTPARPSLLVLHVGQTEDATYTEYIQGGMSYFPNCSSERGTSVRTQAPRSPRAGSDWEGSLRGQLSADQMLLFQAEESSGSEHARVKRSHSGLQVSNNGPPLSGGGVPQTLNGMRRRSILGLLTSKASISSVGNQSAGDSPPGATGVSSVGSKGEAPPWQRRACNTAGLLVVRGSSCEDESEEEEEEEFDDGPVDRATGGGERPANPAATCAAAPGLAARAQRVLKQASLRVRHRPSPSETSFLAHNQQPGIQVPLGSPTNSHQGFARGSWRSSALLSKHDIEQG